MPTATKAPNPTSATLVKNRRGEVTAVRLSVAEYERVTRELKHYRRLSKDLSEFEQVARYMRGVKRAFRELEAVAAGKGKGIALDEVLKGLKTP